MDTVFRSFKLSSHHFLHFLFCSPLSPVHGLTEPLAAMNADLNSLLFCGITTKADISFSSFLKLEKNMQYSRCTFVYELRGFRTLCLFYFFFILNATVHINLVGAFMGSSQTSCISCDTVTGSVCSPGFRLTHWTENSTLSVCQTVSCPNNRPQGCV